LKSHCSLGTKSTLRAIIPRGVRLMVFDLNPFLVTSFQQPKEVTKKGRSLLKFLTAQKGLFYGRQPGCRYKCVSPTFAQMASLPFAPKISLFVLKL
jgi:hypothetical protein